MLYFPSDVELAPHFLHHQSLFEDGILVQNEPYHPGKQKFFQFWGGRPGRAKIKMKKFFVVFRKARTNFYFSVAVSASSVKNNFIKAF